MNIKRPFKISGVGKYLPKKLLENRELENELGLESGWILKNIGVKRRFKAEGETGTDMAVKALNLALLDAQLPAKKLDLIISASATFDQIIPNRSCLIKSKLGLENGDDFPCVDINSVCTSFISALDYASLLLLSGDFENIAIVSSEISSNGLNPKNPETYCLFGDAAAAVIVTKDSGSFGFIAHQQKTFSEAVSYTQIEGGGNLHHVKNNPYNPELFSFKMEGRKLLHLAFEKLPSFIQEFKRKQKIDFSNIDWFLPHQASKMGFKVLSGLEGIEKTRVVNQLAEYGNCIAASIPLVLVNQIETGQIKNGDNCLLIGTAAGMNISSLLFKYGR